MLVLTLTRKHSFLERRTFRVKEKRALFLSVPFYKY